MRSQIKSSNQPKAEEEWKGSVQVLVVDDEWLILRVLQRLLEGEGYVCSLAANAQEARDLLKDGDFDLVLCDLKMPGESGLELARFILSHDPDTAVLMVSGVDDPEIGKTLINLGAYGYVVKPFKQGELLLNIRSTLRRRQLEIDNRAYREKLEHMVGVRTAELQTALSKWRKATQGIVEAVALAVDARDPYTAGHQRNVARIACAIAEKLDFPMEQVNGIRMAGLIHDLGKISIPQEILTKPTQLSESEFSIIKEHPKAAHQILKNIDFPWPIAEMILQHHERMDGSGYPMGLSGDDILIEARILAVADVVEAMASHRPYRPSLGLEKALDEIFENRGKFYDARSVDACLSLFKEDGFNFTL
jgi:putative nucleotidyltransferase with HDIG domain